MVKNYPSEIWKVINFDHEYVNDFRLEISNFGRVRSFNKISDGNLLNGSLVNGYKIIRLKLYTPRDEKVQDKFNQMKKQIARLSSKFKEQKESKANKEIIIESSEELVNLKANLSKKFKADLKARTINQHMLIHRIVAEYFLKKPNPKQTIVAHLDHDKLNNRVTNLKWMEPVENYVHQKSSPHVIKSKEERRSSKNLSSRTAKLSVTKVMFLKKLLNKGVPVKNLSKQFKVTETQILRIKRGENWGDIQAAK